MIAIRSLAGQVPHEGLPGVEAAYLLQVGKADDLAALLLRLAEGGALPLALDILRAELDVRARLAAGAWLFRSGPAAGDPRTLALLWESVRALPPLPQRPLLAAVVWAETGAPIPGDLAFDVEATARLIQRELPRCLVTFALALADAGDEAGARAVADLDSDPTARLALLRAGVERGWAGRRELTDAALAIPDERQRLVRICSLHEEAPDERLATHLLAALGSDVEFDLRVQITDALLRWQPEEGRAALVAQALAAFDALPPDAIGLRGTFARTLAPFLPTPERDRVVDTVVPELFRLRVDPSWRLLVLRQLAPYLTPDAIARLWRSRVKNGLERQQHIMVLAPHTGPERMGELVERARAIRDEPAYRAVALLDLLPLVPEAQRGTVADEVGRAADEAADERFDRSIALRCRLLPHLTPERRRAALQVILANIEDWPRRAVALDSGCCTLMTDAEAVMVGGWLLRELREPSQFVR